VATVQLDDVSDITTPIGTTGTPVSADLTQPGRATRLPFTGTQGQRVSAVVTVTSGNFTCFGASVGTTEIRRADTNALVAGPVATCGVTGATAFVEPVTLPVSGSYVVVVDPLGQATGVATVRLYTVVDVTTAISTNGSAVSVNLNVPGRATRLPFTGTQGQRVSTLVTVTSGTFTCSGAYVGKTEIRRVDTNAIVAGPVSTCGTAGATAFLEPVALPATGNYVVVVDPLGASTGAATVRLYTVVDVTPTITTTGTPVSVNLTVPGRAARVPFTGTQNQRVRLVVNVTSGTFLCSGANVGITEIRRVDTNAVVGGPVATCGTAGASATLPAVTLPASGSYVVVVDPLGSSAAVATVTLSNAP
jgi:uncharacterized protein YhfF